MNTKARWPFTVVRYYARVPSAAVHREIDAHDYAYVGFTVDGAGVHECAPRMMRADRCKHENGEAWIYIGAMGIAIAQRENLPFGVSID